MNVDTEITVYIAVAILIHLAVLLLVTKKQVRNISGKHVVVTGGSSGIGLWTAIICARKGADVTIIARNVNLLEKAIKLLKTNRLYESQKFTYKSLDISKNYSEVDKTLTELEKEIAPIYMLVNCAGMAICGVFEEISVEDAKYLMDVNYFSAYYCTRSVLPKMKARQNGIIVITASQAALLGIYGYGPYAASKFALRGMAETVAMECQHLGISVTLALPNDTNTPGFENEEKSKPAETKIISGAGGLANPEDVGKRIVDDALKGNFFSILGVESWVITTICCGMAPWGGFLQNLIQAHLIGPLKLVAFYLQWHFGRIIRQCAKNKKE